MQRKPFADCCEEVAMKTIYYACLFTFELCLSIWLARSSPFLPASIGWKSIREFISNFNSDLVVLCILRLSALILISAHATKRRKDILSLQTVACILCKISDIYVGLKLLVVSSCAPDELWPSNDTVGLVNMMASILVSLIGSFADGYAVAGVLNDGSRKGRGEHGSLTDPLLAEEEGRDLQQTDDYSFYSILNLALPDLPYNLCAFTAGGVAALAAALVLYYTGQVIDHASIEPDEAEFHNAILMLVYSAIFCSIFTGIRGGLFSMTMARFNKRLKTKVFSAIISFEQGYFDSHTVGDLTSRLNSDTGAVSDKICLTLNVLLRSATQALLVVWFMLQASWRLTATSFVLIPVVCGVSNAYGKIYSALEKKVRDSAADTNAFAEESFSSISQVKTFAAQEETMAAFESQLSSWFNLLIRQALAYSFFASISTFLPSAVSVVVLGFGGILVLEGDMSPGDLVSFMLYQQSLSSALTSIGDVVSSFWAALGSAATIMKIIQRKPAIVCGSLIKEPSELEGRIELLDVHFRYPSRPAPVLTGISLSIKAGEVVALVGQSGGGKSSLVKLINRLYVPEAGQILLDGVPLGNYDDKWLRRQVTMVSQEPTLFARSILRNIIYGLESSRPSMEDVVAASEQANAHGFIQSLPSKYETLCGEKGLALSGGQRQRIAIARALVRKPKILLLDEATSALDAESESIVQDALDNIMIGMQRTTIIVAHRLSTVMNADRILVIAKGQVVEEGNHNDLLEKNGQYAGLVKRQMQRSKSEVSIS